jgi:hypothetical protein
MVKSAFSGISTTRLRDLLRAQPGHEHLDIETHGMRLIIFTVQGDRKLPLARLTLLPRGDYGLSLMWHTGRWERLPIVGTAAEVVDVLLHDFGNLLAPTTNDPA